MNLSNRGIVCCLALTFILASSCASAPGRFEIDARRRQAPVAVIADAIRCDSGKVVGCMSYGQWLFPNDHAASTEAMQHACDLGESGACSVVANNKRPFGK